MEKRYKEPIYCCSSSWIPPKTWYSWLFLNSGISIQFTLPPEKSTNQHHCSRHAALLGPPRCRAHAELRAVHAAARDRLGEGKNLGVLGCCFQWLQIRLKWKTMKIGYVYKNCFPNQRTMLQKRQRSILHFETGLASMVDIQAYVSS